MDDVEAMPREQLEAELLLARKLFWLSARDYIFWSTYNDAKRDWDDGAYPAICTNDVFVYAADAEPLPLSDVDEYIDVCRKFEDYSNVEGVYVAAKTGQKKIKGSPESKAEFEAKAQEIREFLRSRHC